MGSGDVYKRQWPACLCILSAVMVSIWFYNLMLKFATWSWAQLNSVCYKRVPPIFKVLSVDLAQQKEPPDSISASASMSALDSMCASLGLDGNHPLREAGVQCQCRSSHSKASKIKISSKASKRRFKTQAPSSIKISRLKCKAPRQHGFSRCKMQDARCFYWLHLVCSLRWATLLPLLSV